ncbi:helix-turn-helix transcriptional regulator [Actinosynnema sp. NPDC020468]|uniref:helix-turn-helix transcriptional regulator n=1 Tax=Actinosynnema sp. NPDC020468 TaxID=3154488 RepID=UPI0033E5FA59
MSRASSDPGQASAAFRLAGELRRRRRNAGMSQQCLASKVGYTRQYVSMAERVGRNLPSRELIGAIDRVLDADNALNTLREQARGEQQALRHQHAPAKESPSRSSVGGLLAVRSAVRARGDGGTDAVEELLMNTADESAEFLAWAESTNVGGLTVEQMHSEVRRIAHLYLKVPTEPLFARTRALRDRAVSLLAGHQDPRHTRELYAVAGWSLTLLSWISVDLGHTDAASTHGRAAWMCAERADHNPLRAWVCATRHTASFWQGDYAGAAHHAADGLRYSGTGTAKMFLSSALALDLARAGDTDAAGQALRQAQLLSETTGRNEDESEGPLTCSVGRAASLWSDTKLALGDAQEALNSANRAVALFEATAKDHRNLGSERMTRLQQVKAHLVLHDLPAAEDALRPVLDTPPSHRVRPLVRRVTEAGTLARQVGGTADPVTKRIQEAVHDFRRDIGTRELTA